MSRRILSALILACALPGQTQPPPIVDVELHITGPDGRAPANAAALIRSLDRAAFQHNPDISVTTDSVGVARFKMPAGVYQLSVGVPGVGHGDTGNTEFLPGRIARPPLARLVAYGSITGSYPIDACQGDIVIHARGSEPFAEEITAAPTSPGRFAFPEIVAGRWYIWAGANQTGANQKRCTQKGNIAVFPGKSAGDIALSPSTETIFPKRHPQRTEPKQQGVWFRGTVHDESGDPVANAQVMALATYFGGLRMYQITSTTTTDSDGHYELTGEADLESFSAAVLAVAPGHPPAWSWPSAPTQDLVLASKSGSLNVTVVHQGEPAPNITVALYLENVNLRDIWARPDGDASAIENAAYPIATTNSQGVAAFQNLLPGRYRIVATGLPENIRNSLCGFNSLTGLTVESTGIAVSTGETTNYKMNIFDQQNEARFQVTRPDGSPLTGTASVAFGPVDSVYWNSGADFNSSGTSKWIFDRPGIWQVRVMFRDSPITVYPIPEPYFLTAGYVATSPNLNPGSKPVFASKRDEPGSVRIVARGIAGKPLQVALEVNGPSRFSGTTDEHGEAVFKGLNSGQYTVSSSAPDLPEQTFNVQSDTETRVEIKATPVQKPKEPVRVTADPDIVLMGAGGITSHAAGAQALKGKVVLADGITPAMGAQVLYWRAHQKLPSLFAMTNALGDLQPRGLWRTGETSAPESAPGPDSDTVIAFLPGTTGATIQTVSRHDEDLHLVLPHPIILKGRVTVGGISPLRRPGLIRIVAKHSTNEYLSLDTTCDADGNFELAGLTQGSYEVQAALDDIWLSSPVSLVIGSARPKPMRLNIAQPGAPVRVEVRDPSGHPLPAASIKLERDGPLAVLWPKEWVSDSAGSVWFPTLEAGRHKINVGKSSIEFTVPAMPAATINVRITAAPESYGATSPRSAATR